MPRIVRPARLIRSENRVRLRAPEHQHLPRWVQRTHEQADSVLGDILAQMTPSSRADIERQVRELVDTISTGKFSAAWDYPQVIQTAMEKLEAERAEAAATARAAVQKQATEDRVRRDAEAKRRSREVERTRAHMERYKTGNNSAAAQESWQDVLKRLTTGDAG